MVPVAALFVDEMVLPQLLSFFLLSFFLSFLVLIHGQFVTGIWTFATDTRYGHFLFSRLLSFFSGDAADSGRSSF